MSSLDRRVCSRSFTFDRICHVAVQYLTTTSDTDKAWYQECLMCGSFYCFIFISIYLFVNYHLYLGTTNEWRMRLLRHPRTLIQGWFYLDLSCLFIIFTYDRSQYFIIFWHTKTATSWFLGQLLKLSSNHHFHWELKT